ncbi:hypothetical protein BZA70DRAFT_249169 [Myxozyma melibiosi]|uniref:Uncharacterized protein n=1 Tax=Myxozyma melibiosi TaxID=54550 RepID=A0ABR1F3C4_9ASCO
MHNFIAYTSSTGASRVGSLDFDNSLITPLSFPSGTPVTSLYDVINYGSTFSLAPSAECDPVPLDSVSIEAPFTGRDILAVGKNYYDHAKEFNSSGFDSSDKVDTPSDPVIFTKRSSSIVPCGADIYLHPGFTSTLDFEGEVGVVIGKPAYKVAEKDAMDYVWGYTIINDATARERQRDHKQFFIGKSADTLCPMGPVAVPKEDLPEYLELQTKVNGLVRQSDSTKNLIFSIPTLINVLSSGMTLQPGDVIATGTPAGVGIGLKPPVYLKAGDVVEVSVTGLGTLVNKVSDVKAAAAPVALPSLPSRVITDPGLTKVGSKYLYFEDIGNKTSDETLICVHGLGCCGQYFSSLVDKAGFLEKYRVVLVDLEGFGRSLTFPDSTPSLHSYSEDIYEITKLLGITKNISLIGFSMGCGVTETFAVNHPDLVKKYILLSPLMYPVPAHTKEVCLGLAKNVRKSGMQLESDKMAKSSMYIKTQIENPLAKMYVLTLLKMTDVEGYAKGAMVLATDGPIAREKIEKEVLLVTGEFDEWPPMEEVEAVQKEYANASTKIVVIPNAKHFHILENFPATLEAVTSFL